MYWEKDIETMPREKLEAVQLECLKSTLQRAATSPHYSGVFKEKGFDPAKLNSLRDVNNIPLTTKEDLRASWPYGLLTVSKDELVRMHSSSDTTGRRYLSYDEGCPGMGQSRGPLHVHDGRAQG
jgi:phenylacetate-CoA ligase